MLFETRTGAVRLRWNDRGLTAIELTELSPREVRAAKAKDGDAPPPFVRAAAALLARHLDGEPQDLSSLPLDLSALPVFQRAVLEAARGVPAGQTVSYAEIAQRIGKPGASRAVGQALGRNPFLVAIPCHRVLASNGKPGGFSAPGGLFAKRRLLALEGVAIPSGLDFDPDEALRHLRAVDRRLAALIDRVPFRLRTSEMQKPFEALAKSIVYQQLTGKAAATIWGRLIQAVRPRPEDVLGAPDETLRAAGLSRGKTLAIKDLARKTLDGTVPTMRALRKLPDEVIVERLTAVRGIGPWTVEMLLIFRLGRPDVLPVTDYGVRKGFASLYGKRELPTPKALLAAGEKWRPYRSVASWYLWRQLES